MTVFTNPILVRSGVSLAAETPSAVVAKSPAGIVYLP
jgi:hypothetical protein